MIEMALLKPSKMTENKLRWSAYIAEDDTKFALYIPKRCVPTPWPGRILVQISSFEADEAILEEVQEEDTLIQGIRAKVERYEERTKTVRYRPMGDQQNWCVGEPYIPYSLIPADAKTLLIQVYWDLETCGNFFTETPTN